MRPATFVSVLVVYPIMAVITQPASAAGEPVFAARKVYQVDGPVYGLAYGEFDASHPGGEVACLLADASVLQISPNGFNWSAIMRHKGLTTIGGMIDRPTICIGDVHSGYPGNEIVIDGGKYLTALYPGASWSYEILFTVGAAGAGWGSRIGNIDSAHPGDEILHSYEGVMDRGTLGLFRQLGSLWQEDIIYSAEVVMDSAVGEFDSSNSGPEIVAVTEMGPAYEITPAANLPETEWPKRVIWNNSENAGWVVKIADVDPNHSGNEIIYGTRYSDRITMSYPAGSAGHQLQILFTGTAPPGYKTMYDIAVGDVLPAAGPEILGVDATGSVYLVNRSGATWQGRAIWQDTTGPLHAVVAGDFLPGRQGDEILVAGQSGAFTLLMLASSADFDRDGDVDADDFGMFENCFSGPQIPLAEGCEDRDFDADGDVDQADFGIFQRCYSGENNPSDPNCGN